MLHCRQAQSDCSRSRAAPHRPERVPQPVACHDDASVPSAAATALSQWPASCDTRPATRPDAFSWSRTPDSHTDHDTTEKGPYRAPQPLLSPDDPRCCMLRSTPFGTEHSARSATTTHRVARPATAPAMFPTMHMHGATDQPHQPCCRTAVSQRAPGMPCCEGPGVGAVCRQPSDHAPANQPCVPPHRGARAHGRRTTRSSASVATAAQTCQTLQVSRLQATFRARPMLSRKGCKLHTSSHNNTPTARDAQWCVAQLRSGCQARVSPVVAWPQTSSVPHCGHADWLQLHKKGGAAPTTSSVSQSRPPQ